MSLKDSKISKTIVMFLIKRIENKTKIKKIQINEKRIISSNINF